jgi:hypothetical protein
MRDEGGYAKIPFINDYLKANDMPAASLVSR